MNLHRPAYLAQITQTIARMHPTPTPISLEKPYTWTPAHKLVSGDVILTKRFEFDEEIYSVDDDDYYGVWIETSHDMGYVDHSHEFRVER